jgi:hypothetical protein
MQFRRSGQRDSRRRRVLTDLLLGSSPAARRSATFVRQSTQHGSEHYGDALFLDEQLRLTDLVPRRLIALFLLFVTGLLMVAGMEALYAWMPNLAAFDVASRGGLAVWFSSTVLLLSALVAVLVYSVRRYRKDDYQGHYRVWLWAALCWFLLSIDETANLHEGFKEMMTLMTGTRLLGDGSMWWVIAYFFLLGGVGIRLLIDMRHCRLSTASMAMVALGYALAIAARLGWILPETGAKGIMFKEGAEMVGNLFLLLAMSLHARYVILDAEGLLPQPENHEDEDDEDEEAEYDAEEVAAEEAALFGQPLHVHSAHTLKRPTSSPNRTLPKADAFTAGMAAAEGQVRRKLTKQEKKALRQRLEKQRRERRSA